MTRLNGVMRVRVTAGADAGLVVRDGLSEQRFVSKEGVSHVQMWGQGFPFHGNSSCKGPEVAVSVACLWSNQGPRMA